MIKDIKTINKIEVNNGGDYPMTIEEGDRIKVTLQTGEVLIGELESCFFNTLTLERENNDIDIEFREIEDIEILERANATEAAE
jgi:hypothetical protein